MRDLSHINTVLFDLDGTLMDSNGVIAESWRHTVRTMAGRDISDDDIISTFGQMLLESFERLVPEIDAEEARDFFRDYQRGIFLDRIKLFDGAEEVLRALKKHDYKTGLVTSRLRGSTERALEHFGITDLFDAVLTASETDKHKPDPAPIFITLDMIGSKPGGSILVGDTDHDIEAAQAAGVRSILVDWSLAVPPEKRTMDPVPDIVIKDMHEILHLLGI